MNRRFDEEYWWVYLGRWSKPSGSLVHPWPGLEDPPRLVQQTSIFGKHGPQTRLVLYTSTKYMYVRMAHTVSDQYR